MPYKSDGSDVPEAVAKRSAVKRRQWAAVWNSAYEKCAQEDGEDCEARAFAQANSVVMGEAAALHRYTYNGVTVRASRRRPSTRDAKKYMRDVADGDRTRVVHYGDPELPMQRDNPERRANFLARHNCAEKRDPFAPGFWACYDWKDTTEEVAMEGQGAARAQIAQHLNAALELLAQWAMPDAPEAMPEPMETAETAEMAQKFSESAMPIITLVETEAPRNRRGPLDMDVAIIKVGPGNARDRHYYTREMLERDGHVFNGLTMHVVDHREDLRAETTDVSTITEIKGVQKLADGQEYLVARVVAYDPDFCEKTRNRAERQRLGQLQCSIIGEGEATAQEIDGESYNVVTAINKGLYVDWVTRAGAGGHALALAESAAEPEADALEDEDPAATQPTEAAPAPAVKGVLLTEDAAPPAPVEVEEVIGSLPLAEVLAELGKTNLPAASVVTLAEATYPATPALTAAIATEVARLKAAGSGQPVAFSPPPAPSRTDPQAAMVEVNRKWLGNRNLGGN